MNRHDLVFVPSPSLAAILLAAWRNKGEPLNEEEVIAISDAAIGVAVTRDMANEIATNRGYDDVDLENVWNSWEAMRADLWGANC